MNAVALRISGVGKSFFGVTVLSDVTLDVLAGRVLGLVGQNGAGKSTLMNIVGGNVAADSGSMELSSLPYAPSNARDAEGRGVGFIHQELNLFPNLTIAENTHIARMPIGRFGLIDRAALHARTTELLRDVDLDFPPDTPLGRLSPGERQLVEVAKALQIDARILIFDEPTTSLTPRETSRLFALIRRLRQAGIAIIYISHVLSDVEGLADDIAVLRDGRLVASAPTSDLPAARMIKLMLGRGIDQLYPQHEAPRTQNTLLEAQALSRPGVIKEVSLSLHKGEVLGIFGLLGSGRTELARILFGLDHYQSGELKIGGIKVTHIAPRRAIDLRMAFITEDRRDEGLMMNMPIADNLVLASLGRFASPLGVIDDARLMASAAELAQGLEIKSERIATQPVRTLSGGNQQKVVIAKWLMSDPAIIILDEPTRGIDVAAKYEIYSLINRLAVGGSGIILISSEIEEAMAMSDRILVMRKGQLTGEFRRSDFAKEAILRAAFGEELAA